MRKYRSAGRILFFAAILIVHSTLSGQIICPPGEGQLIPDISFTENGKIFIKIAQGNNEQVSGCWCRYQNRDRAYEKTSVLLEWIEANAAGGAIGVNQMCQLNPVAIPSMGIDPAFFLNHPSRAIQSTFYYTRPGDIQTVRSIAGKLIAVVEARAASCRNVQTAGVNTDNPGPDPSSCQQKLEQLRKIKAQYWSTSQRLKTLQAVPAGDINRLRDSLSYFSKLTAAMKEYEATGHYNGGLYTEVNRLQNDPVYRSWLAKQSGLNPDLPSLSIIRSIRDQYAARIDYHNDAGTFIDRYKKDLAGKEKLIQSLHAELSQRQCPGEYDITGCDLSGDWIITEWDSDDDERYYSRWSFLPKAKGVYTALNKSSGQLGEAETGGHEVVLRLQTYGRNYTDEMKFNLGENCDFALEEKKFSDYTAYRKVERSKPPATGYLKDMLYEIAHDGYTYQCIYQQQSDQGIAIDAFYYRVLGPSGYQIEQDRVRLWGRFVRKPSAGTREQDPVQWWFVKWVFEDSRWVEQATLLTAAPVIR